MKTYIFWGKVKKGKQRGKSLGFPTANIILHTKIPDGIYISRIKIDKKMHPSLTFIGKVKTFNEQKYQAEVYILDYNKQIYQKWITIYLLKKIRENKKFESGAELIKQMKEDEKEARKYFSTHYFLPKH